MHSAIAPGTAVQYKGATWTVRKTQLRGPDSVPERWALLVVTSGAGTKERIVAREWVRYRDINTIGLTESGEDGENEQDKR
jgi:hypothetical protein